MKVAEIRRQFIEFFKKNEHTHVESGSLVPANDPTLLFTNAGMVQFKDLFTGKETRKYVRAVTVQKCVRAGGKHNDIENVGFTARHHTFFEMLGNFSFGDYFKTEAISLAWEFVTKVLLLDTAKLHVTVYQDDDEAYDIWHKTIGIEKNKISRFDEKDNFWSMGETGPCGPCSEIFFDRGEKAGCGQPTCKVGCECDRYLEFWNLVFMQFNKDAEGTLSPLPKPSVDTGMGLERVASILQGAASNYETDGFVDIMKATATLAQREISPDSPDVFPLRVIADHSRAVVFLIADGVLPSNEGKGYVLRRILRRAVRYGRNLGFQEPFLYSVCDYVIKQLGDIYPNIVQTADFIKKVVIAEEEQFFRTLEKGLQILDTELKRVGTGGCLSGEIAFKLYDTYGFPLDLTKVISKESQVDVDDQGFNTHMDQQRQQSRLSWKGSGEEAHQSIFQQLAERLKRQKQEAQFVGYRTTQCESSCLAVIITDINGKMELSDQSPLKKVESFQAVFDRSPFYPEGGGQVGDIGTVRGPQFEGIVTDSQKPVEGLPVLTIKPIKGVLETTTKKTYQLVIDSHQRSAIEKNHTATHLLHWALRKTLGDHVQQAGSLVTAEMLRFDFTHFQKMTPSELTDVESSINDKIWNSQPVEKITTDKNTAISKGAIAFFSEKYADKVRVVSIGDFSLELCGGTHVNVTNEIHLFKIISESSIAAGVRRIVALTSKAAFDHLTTQRTEWEEVKNKLNSSDLKEVQSKIEKFMSLEKELKKQKESIKSKGLNAEMEQLLQTATPYKGFHLIVGKVIPDVSGMKKLRDLSEKIRQKSPKAITFLGMVATDRQKCFIVISKGKEAPTSFNANIALQKVVSEINGKGGGKNDMAQAGGSQINGLNKILEKASTLVTEFEI